MLMKNGTGSFTGRQIFRRRGLWSLTSALQHTDMLFYILTYCTQRAQVYNRHTQAVCYVPELSVDYVWFTYPEMLC